MTRSVARQREPWPARIEAASLRELRQEIGRAHRNGELAASGPIHQLEYGGYFVNVYRLKDRPVVPAWRRPVLVASGAVLALGGAAALGWWLVGVTAALVLAWGPMVATGAGVLLFIRGVSRPSGCTVTVTHRRH